MRASVSVLRRSGATPARVQLRAVGREEAEAVWRLAASRTEPAGVVQRGRIIRALLEEPTLSAGGAARRVGFTREDVGPVSVRRFNTAGLDGLHDAPRSGRPPTHTADVHGLPRRARLLDRPPAPVHVAYTGTTPRRTRGVGCCGVPRTAQYDPGRPTD